MRCYFNKNGKKYICETLLYIDDIHRAYNMS